MASAPENTANSSDFSRLTSFASLGIAISAVAVGLENFRIPRNFLDGHGHVNRAGHMGEQLSPQRDPVDGWE
jgi:hypothetical protein